jgi:biopolymer transport protein ExbD
MARHSIVNDEESPDIDLSPMIDCIFLLRIFFIVTTVFVEERGLPVTKPDAAASTAQQEKDSVVIEITAEGKLRIGDQEVGLADVTSRVKAGIGDGDTPVVIRSHEKSHHGSFVAVWDAAKKGGAEALSFTTIN